MGKAHVSACAGSGRVRMFAQLETDQKKQYLQGAMLAWVNGVSRHAKG
jgi:hypothetical protein